jgi:DNA-binding response OmpR family regulator
VVTAVGAYDGLKKLREAYPDLIVMAQELPPVNGENACLRIRQASYILMMVVGPAEETVDTFELGADAYMSRPPSDVELAAKARSLLRRKQRYDPPGGNSPTGLEIESHLSKGDDGSNRLTGAEFRLGFPPAPQ